MYDKVYIRKEKVVRNFIFSCTLGVGKPLKNLTLLFGFEILNLSHSQECIVCGRRILSIYSICLDFCGNNYRKSYLFIFTVSFVDIYYPEFLEPTELRRGLQGQIQGCRRNLMYLQLCFLFAVSACHYLSCINVSWGFLLVMLSASSEGESCQ